MTRTLAIVLSLAAVPACKGDSSSEASGEKAAASLDVAAVQAAVPTELAEAIRFEKASQDKDRLVVAAPAGWESEHMRGSYEPPRDADLGFFTSFGVGSNCDGSCAAKDWKATAGKVEFAQFTEGGFEVVADEATDSGRFLKATKDDGVYLRFAWWKKDASRYFFCRATLEGKAKAAAPAFEKACRSMAIVKWD